MSNERPENERPENEQPENEQPAQAMQQSEPLELTMQAAMQRVDAPAGFADRVMARVAAEGAGSVASPTPKRRLLVFPRRAMERGMTLRRHNPWLAGSMAAGLLLAGVLGHQAYRQHERAVANQQFATTLRVEQQTMNHVRAQLAAAGVPMEE
jgi:hypothetical protein